METLENAKQIYKACRVTALAFENGYRAETYACIDIITALKFVARHNGIGNQTLILPVTKKTMRWEIQNKKRIPFAEAVRFAINSNTLISVNAPTIEQKLSDKEV